MTERLTVYERAGGEPTFAAMIDAFYDGIESEPLLRPMYPDDLKESRWNLQFFLMQYFGGPATYSGERGHPRLRMRHVPFEIGRAERDAWMRNMRRAIEKTDMPADVRTEMIEYFEKVATFLMNRPVANGPAPLPIIDSPRG